MTENLNPYDHIVHLQLPEGEAFARFVKNLEDSIVEYKVKSQQSDDRRTRTMEKAREIYRASSASLYAKRGLISRSR